VNDAQPEPNPTHELSTNGVGPWRGELPTDDHYDPELLERGDTRNVIDRYRYWTMAAIVADLDEHRHEFHVAIENWQHDMNIGSIVRSANAFAADTVHIIGRKRWNKRGAMVTDRYQHIMHHETVAAFVEWATKHELPIMAIDNMPGALCAAVWSRRSGVVARGARRSGCPDRDQPVRFDPQPQRFGRRCRHHALLDHAARFLGLRLGRGRQARHKGARGIELGAIPHLSPFRRRTTHASNRHHRSPVGRRR
jgi:hypothetical protein